MKTADELQPSSASWLAEPPDRDSDQKREWSRRATMVWFVSHGTYVIIADLQDGLSQTLAKRLIRAGYGVFYIQYNATDWKSSYAAF